MKEFLILVSFTFITLSNVYTQVYSDKLVGDKTASYADSIQNEEYEYLLPIWGQQAHEAGFELPYSAGLGINYFYQNSDIIINNLNVGFNNGQMYDLNEVVRFNNTTSSSGALNFRPDVWIFPFLNVYAIFAKSNVRTNVDFSLWVPKNDIWEEVVALETKAEFDAVSTGFGITPTMGIGGGWMALDMNFTWTDISELEDPAYSFVFGPRFGKSFRFDKPERNVAVWVGGFRIHLNTGTTGSLPLSDFISTDGIDEKIDNGIITVGDAQVVTDEWWNGLSNLQQNNPVNVAKYEAANRAIAVAAQFLNGLESGVANLNTSSVQYALDKKQAKKWNFIVGTQFQLNKNWMLRGEFGFLGERSQGIFGLQYRFGV